MDAKKKFSNRCAFLDTTYIISKELSHSENRKKIKRNLKDKKLKTSYYVVHEFKRTLLYDCIILHSIVQREESVEDVHYRLRKFFYMRDRHTKRCLDILENLREKGFNTKDELLVALEILIEGGLERECFDGIEKEEYGTRCKIAYEEPKKQNKVYLMDTTCRKDIDKCDITKFFRERKRFFLRIIAHCEKNYKDSGMVKKVCPIIELCLKDYKKARGNNCKNLGDSIICVECPKDCTIYTTNHKDFRPICSAIGKKLFP